VGSRGSWYPGSGRRYATYDLTFRLDRDLNFVSTGEVIERAEEGSTAVYRVKVDKPVRTFGFNIGKYKAVTRERNGFTVNVMANEQVETALEPQQRVVVIPSPPVATGRRQRLPQTYTTMPAPRPNPAQRLQDLGNEVVTLLEDFSERFGPPPVQTINVSPIPGHFGQGFAGMIYLSTITYLHESQRPAYVRDEQSRMFFSNLLLAHELSHQWWGNLVYTESDQDEWLMEGLATYSSLLVLERQQGRKATEEVLLRYRDHLLWELEDGRSLESAGPVIWGTRLINSRDRNAWMTIIYEKGAWIFHMLRARMGDENFHRMLKGIPERFADEPMTTLHFQKYAAGFLPEDSDDRDLEDFFAQWVESTGIPHLSMETRVSGNAPKVKVEVELNQSMVTDDFGALVPIHIYLSRDKKEVRWVRASNDGEEAIFTFPSRPSRIELDPEWATLRRD
jgi:aminopeptidase N